VEVTSKEMRGSFAIFEGVVRSLGMILVYSLGAMFDWDHIALFAPIVPLLAFLLLFWSPESPVHLASIGQQEMAERSLRRILHRDIDPSPELKRINLALEEQKTRSVDKMNYVRNIHRHPEVYKPFLIILLLSIAQQFSGATILRGYVVKIFGSVFSPKVSELITTNQTHLCTCDCAGGPPLSRSAYFSAILIGIVRLLASLSLTSLLVKFKRRHLYLFSASATILALCSFATSLLLGHHIGHWNLQNLQEVINWSSVISACILVFSVNLGVQPMPLLMSSELFPADVRAICKVNFLIQNYLTY
jgi:hypothetical protein